ncbi:alpha-glucuronidase family glycosyl hydrolase [Zunongwangia sp. F363]|uniref:Xylan alpha-1,2-glucuronidase n=1 Tax=Autumnicola tepida TaxID=3075595 RepID=A0ABU3CB35_9FLAO|nr:alpha-glucuronidase family glycosyl hydrolase [Zunongwangia sp. F363]MDT0643546.1 alpha-glucuronidase family glycosyl hydrolase [Zunongwangia sp. F363]
MTVVVNLLRFKLMIFSIVMLFIARDVQGNNLPSFEDGHRMWLRYETVKNIELLEQYKSRFASVVLNDNSGTMSAIKKELKIGLKGLLSIAPQFRRTIDRDGAILISTPESPALKTSLKKVLIKELKSVGNEGFILQKRSVNGYDTTIISANTDIGLLYGTFHLLRLMQTGKSLSRLNIKEFPEVQLRVANHWDNIDRSVERGYAGLSLWDWKTLPNYKDPRYTDYARLSSSVGINGVVINNVNANAEFITSRYLDRIATLANIFRPYGIKIYLSINFNSPQLLGNLNTADPLDEDVREWWRSKVQEIYNKIPDMGGFLVKADSEGQPGPNTYGRTHSDGANLLADALKPHGGIVMWRAFVYGEKQEDRIREAYDEFVPLDGEFNDNVILQVKKGPLDFMPMEPFSPLFGAMPNTNTMIEFQVTQEYLGNANHLLYKGKMYNKILMSDTYAHGKGTLVGDIISGKIFKYNLTGMAGVINPGTARNWTGHPFVQSSWYAFGRLAWNYQLDPDKIAREWIQMTFSNEEKVVEKIQKIMSISSEAAVNYREPLGLTHIGTGSHYGPAPWSKRSQIFHHADEVGIGFNRSTSGSSAVSQYHEPLASEFNNLSTIPEELLLWFHHVRWDYTMKSGNSLWEELVNHYHVGVNQVREMQELWDFLENEIDTERFNHVKSLLEIQERDAVRWRDACLLYFQSFSRKEIPKRYEQPKHSLQYYKSLKE